MVLWGIVFNQGKMGKNKKIAQKIITQKYLHIEIKFLEPNKKVAIAHEAPDVALVPPVWPF